MEWNDSPIEGDKQQKLLQKLNEKYSFLNQYKTVETSEEEEFPIEIQEMLAEAVERDDHYYNVDNFLNQYSSQQDKYIKEMNKYSESVNSVSSVVNGIHKEYKKVENSVEDLYQKCDSLLNEKSKLDILINDLTDPLSYFQDIHYLCDSFGVKFAGNELIELSDANPLNPQSDSFNELLNRLDQCLKYAMEHPGYCDGPDYAERYRSLMYHALCLIRNHITEALKVAVIQTHTRLENISSSDLAQVNIQFSSISKQLRPLIKSIQIRSILPSLHPILENCEQSYSESRLNILQKATSTYFDGLYAINGESLVKQTRSSCAYMVELCREEYNMYSKFFGTLKEAEYENCTYDTEGGLRILMEDVTTILYGFIRPLLIKERNIENICEYIQILRGEVIEGMIKSRGNDLTGMIPSIHKLIKDGQERLIYLTMEFYEGLKLYRPRPKDIDYPQKLLDYYENKLKVQLHQDEKVPITLSEMRESAIYSAWYPPLEYTLTLLSHIYTCLDAKVFEEIAQKVVNQCSFTFYKAHKIIQNKVGPLNADLFLVKHLLIIREQITPFNITTCYTEKTLDFKSTAHAVNNVIGGNMGVDSLSKLLTYGLPQVKDSNLNSQRELEKELKDACDVFMKHCILYLLGELKEIVEKSDEFSSIDILKEQSFFSNENLFELLTRTKDNVISNISTILKRTALYLGNPMTQSILWKPILRECTQLIRRLSFKYDKCYGENEDFNNSINEIRDIITKEDPQNYVIEDLVEGKEMENVSKKEDPLYLPIFGEEEEQQQESKPVVESDKSRKLSEVKVTNNPNESTTTITNNPIPLPTIEKTENIIKEIKEEKEKVNTTSEILKETKMTESIENNKENEESKILPILLSNISIDKQQQPIITESIIVNQPIQAPIDDDDDDDDDEEEEIYETPMKIQPQPQMVGPPITPSPLVPTMNGPPITPSPMKQPDLNNTTEISPSLAYGPPATPSPIKGVTTPGLAYGPVDDSDEDEDYDDDEEEEYEDEEGEDDNE